MILAYLLATWVPYVLYSAFVGPLFAVGYRAAWVAAWHLAAACYVAYTALPGRRERIAAAQAILALCGAALTMFVAAPTGGYREYGFEYLAITGACLTGAAQCGLAAAWGIWRKG